MSESSTRPGSFLAPVARVQAELREKGSRFLGILLPAEDEKQVGSQLEGVRSRYSDGTHHCWAYRLGFPARQRSSDDGEPVGTAGAPMLNVLARRGLSNVHVVVVRWFGGTKLGKGGLARAYGATVREAVEVARLVERFPTVVLEIELPYDRLGAVKRLLRPPQVELVTEHYEDSVRLTLRVAESVERELETALADIGVAPVRGSS